MNNARPVKVSKFPVIGKTRIYVMRGEKINRKTELHVQNYIVIKLHIIIHNIL